MGRSEDVCRPREIASPEERPSIRPGEKREAPPTYCGSVGSEEEKPRKKRERSQRERTPRQLALLDP